MFEGKSSLLRKGLYLAAGAALLSRLPRLLAGIPLKRASKRLLQDPYRENLWAMISSLNRMGPQVALENSKGPIGQGHQAPLRLTAKPSPSIA